ncbi:MAG: SCO family protein [Desulforhopalus sp.]
MKSWNSPKVIAGGCLMLVMAMFYLPCLARGESGSGLLEQTKTILADTDRDNTRWVEEKTGQFLPLDLEFTDETGETVRLGDIIDRPTILLPIYFYCPNICSRNLSNLAIALNNLSSRPGKDYRVVALSFNEAETFEDAALAKKNYLKILDDGFPAAEWRFLTGSAESIRAATDAVGFRFQKVDDETFIHPAALMAIAGDGKIIRYVYGSFLAGDIDMALSDASSGRPSLSVKRLLAFCFNYDPDKNKAIFQQVKATVLVVFGLIVAGVFIYFKRKSPKEHRRS